MHGIKGCRVIQWMRHEQQFRLQTTLGGGIWLPEMCVLPNYSGRWEGLSILEWKRHWRLCTCSQQWCTESDRRWSRDAATSRPMYHSNIFMVRKVLKTFETSRPTWVSVQDVALNTLKDRPRNQVNRSQSSATLTTHKQTWLCSCRYGSCWRVTPWHKTNAESPVDIFLPTSQKRSKTHVVTKSLYIKTWFVCSNKFECLKTVETFQAPKHVLWCLPQIC